jgi:hypothetical protein
VVLGLKAIGAYADLAAAAASLVCTDGAIEPAAPARVACENIMADYEKAYARLYHA